MAHELHERRDAQRGSLRFQFGTQWAIPDNSQVQVLWRQHLSGSRNWQHMLWPVLMFLAWKQTYADKIG